MFAKLRQVTLSLVVVGTAFGAGLIAVGLLDPSPFLASPSGGPAAGATAGSSARSAWPSAPEPIATEPPEDVAVLVGAGDIAECDRPEDELTADLVERIPGTVFTAGDNANPGSRASFRDCYEPTWGRPSIKDRTRPAAGDADYEDHEAAGYYEYFGDAAGEAGAGYYAYDAGAWRVYVLNTNCGNVGGCAVGSPQATWLRDDLAREPRRCALAIFHHPFFTSGPSEGGDPERGDLWRILESAGAELVVSGHDHHYERFAPQTSTGDTDTDGMIQLIAGTGGSRPDRVSRAARNSEIHATGVFGVLRLELRPRGYGFEFIGVAGPEFRDSGSGDCH